MILFFKTPEESVIAVAVDHELVQTEKDALCWLFGGAEMLSESQLEGRFVGPRREMVTPWSTNAVEITQNMNLSGISRIEEFVLASPDGGEVGGGLFRPNAATNLRGSRPRDFHD